MVNYENAAAYLADAKRQREEAEKQYQDAWAAFEAAKEYRQFAGRVLADAVMLETLERQGA